VQKERNYKKVSLEGRRKARSFFIEGEAEGLFDGEYCALLEDQQEILRIAWRRNLEDFPEQIRRE